MCVSVLGERKRNTLFPHQNTNTIVADDSKDFRRLHHQLLVCAGSLIHVMQFITQLLTELRWVYIVAIP